MARPRIRVLLRAGAWLALALLAAACGMVPPEPHTVEAKEVFWLYNVILVMGGIVFVAVEGFIVYSVVRYRRRDDRLPTQVHGNNLVELIWTAIPTVIVLILFVLSTLTLNSISKASTPGVTIEVVGKQWSWVFHYLDDDGDPANDVIVEGTALNGLVMALPVGEPVKLRLISNDVIHSFFVPAFLVKIDVVPLPEGKPPNELSFTVSEVGTYSGQCAEFCGLRHADMTFSVEAMSRADFDAWVAAIRSGETPAPSVPAEATVLKVSADDTAFDTKALEVAAGQTFKIEFANNEDVDHNVGIWKGGEELFRGEIFAGPATKTYVVDGLTAGEYTFICDVHPLPAMTGTLTVK
ncbi:MAG: cytochrome c oxidase subunit II [Chloroflexota bacterium]